MLKARLLAIVLSLCWLPAAIAQTARPEPERPVVTWDRSAGTVILQLHTEIGMIAGAEKGPVITVYGDGTVEAYYPFYMQRAGLWRMHLPPAELDALVSVAVNARLFELDGAALGRAIELAAVEKDVSTGKLQMRSDPEWTQLDMRLRMSTGKGESPLEHSIRARDLRWNARRYPEIADLVALAGFVDNVQALARSPMLEQVAQ